MGEVTWDGHVAVIGYSDQQASNRWMHSHSLLQRLAIHHRDLYWDNKKVDLGKATGIDLALKSSHDGTFIVAIEEKDGSRYNKTVELHAGENVGQ